MTDPDLKELADLWQQPDAGEQAAFETIARKARFRARFLRFTDVALAAVLVIGMVLGFLLKPQPLSALIALLVIAATVWLVWARARFHHISRTLDTSDRESFLASSKRSARAGLRRVNLSLTFFPLLALLAVLSKLSSREGGQLVHPLETLAAWTASPRGVVVISLVAIIVFFLYRSRQNFIGELRRLDALNDAYREEARLEDRAEE